MPAQRILAFECHRECLPKRPTARSLGIEIEACTQPIEAIQNVLATVAERVVPHDRRDAEFAFPNEGFWIDREPRLAFGREHIVGVQVLMQKHGFLLRSRQRHEDVDGRNQQRLLERTFGALHFGGSA